MSAVRDAGLYTKTMEAMLFSSPTENIQEKKAFKDANLLQKKKSVSRLVEKFEKCQLDETIDQALDDMHSEPSNVAPTPKPRSVNNALETSIEDIEGFFQGIRTTSSPIPTTPEQPATPEAVEVFHDLQETLAKKTGPKNFNFGIPDIKNAQPIHHRDSILVRKGQISESRSSRTKTRSTCSSESSSSSSTGSATPSGSSVSNGSEDMDKIARSISECSVYDSVIIVLILRITVITVARFLYTELFLFTLGSLLFFSALRNISKQVSAIRLEALQGASEDSKTRIMVMIHEKCVNGKVTKEMDALNASIFDLMDKNVNEKQLSIYEEYVVKNTILVYKKPTPTTDEILLEENISSSSPDVSTSASQRPSQHLRHTYGIIRSIVPSLSERLVNLVINKR
uniref:Peroxin-14 n=1 Tax=Caenorhabditis tropicalis TaxID=1561998 RepID=A0A1I7TPM3_9PELO